MAGRRSQAGGKIEVRSERMKAPDERGGVVAAALALVVVIGTLAGAAIFEAADADRYYRSVQEDEALEWATFWAFLGAAALNLAVAFRASRRGVRIPWFPVGVALFCIFVAMEEISWGQRVLGYRPPAYFLEENYQQELNLHNVFATSLRKGVLKAVILGYGVALPLLARVPTGGRLLSRAGGGAPSLSLAPAFLATWLAYEWYPWSHTGEWVELTLGLGFLFAVLPATETANAPSKSRSRAGRAAAWVALATGLVWALGAAGAAASRLQRSASPEILEAARAEVEMLRRDFLEKRVRTSCGLHKRLYTFVEQYDADALLAGRFVALTERGLPEERAAYFLDPWNSPYWIRDRCERREQRRSVFVYSFGPNRVRDSTHFEIREDDVGAYLRRRPRGDEE